MAHPSINQGTQPRPDREPPAGIPRWVFISVVAVALAALLVLVLLTTRGPGRHSHHHHHGLGDVAVYVDVRDRSYLAGIAARVVAATAACGDQVTAATPEE